MYRMLIVDDEALVRRGLQQIIPWREYGFEVAGVLDHAEQALQMLQKGGIDVLLTDINMPGQSGLELAAEARKRNPRIHIVVISGYDRFDYAVGALKVQVDDYILKPLDPKLLCETFRKLRDKLDEERKREELQRQWRYMEDEHIILRLLGQELLRPRRFREMTGGAFIRLILVCFSDQTDAAVPRKKAALSEQMSGYFHMEGEMLFAVYLPAEAAEEFLAAARRALEGLEKVRIAQSRAFHPLSEAYAVFLHAAEELWNSQDGKVLKLGNGAQNGEKGFNLLKERLLRILEKGEERELEEELSLLFRQIRKQRLFSGIALCRDLLISLLRSFGMEEYQRYALLDFSNAPPGDYEKLEEVVRSDARLLLKTLRMQAANPVLVITARSKQFIESRYADPDFSLSELAERLGMSYNYLSTVFKKETGISLKSYLTTVRMEKAHALILERKYKIRQIAGMVGYHNPRYFTDAFRNYYQISPQNYIQRIGGEHRDPLD